VTPLTTRLPERFRVVPDAFVKFNVVTVVDAAERPPVRTRVVPVAFVKFNSEMVPELETRVVKFAVEAMRFVLWSVVAKRLVPEAFVKLSVVTVDEPALKFPVRASVVPVASVQVRDVVPRFVMVPFVTKRFVDVVFVPVAFVQVMFDVSRDPALKTEE
jgi:hypothetical protein